MNELQIFEKAEFGKVRIVMRNGEPWFVARDVAEALGYTWSGSRFSHVPEEWKGMTSVVTPGGEQEMLTISHADDFTRSHPVLTGKRKGTTLRERLERIRDTTRKASVREAAEQWLRKMEATA